jgi:hypothetical protein
MLPDEDAASDGVAPASTSAYGVELDALILRASLETPLVGEELAVLRASLHELWHKDHRDYELIRKNVHEIVRTVQAAYRMSPAAAEALGGSLAQVLRQVGEQLLGEP